MSLWFNTSHLFLPKAVISENALPPSEFPQTILFKMKKVTEKNLRVNDIIYNQENASELFEVESLQDGIGIMISLTHHADCQTIDSYIFGCNGETWVFATGEEIVANRKNEMNTKNFKIFILYQ
jgi:hypothetical protein